jgi:hypothetical protein
MPMLTTSVIAASARTCSAYASIASSVSCTATESASPACERRAQQPVLDRAVLGVVDALAGEHRVAVRSSRSRAPGRTAAARSAGVDQVLGQVGEDVRRLLAEVAKRPASLREGVAQVEAAPAFESGLQLPPGGVWSQRALRRLRPPASVVRASPRRPRTRGCLRPASRSPSRPRSAPSGNCASSYFTAGCPATSRAGIERALQRRVGRRQLRQQLGADGQQVAAGQRQDLADVAEARAHHLGGDAEVLVVLVDLRAPTSRRDRWRRPSPPRPRTRRRFFLYQS